MEIHLKTVIAKAIFEWLNGGASQGNPYTFNADEDRLEIGVDGDLDCNELAAAIEKVVEQNRQP